MDTETQTLLDNQSPAMKAAKPKKPKVKKLAAKKTAKPKAKKKVVKAKKAAKKAKPYKHPKPKARPARVIVRTERLDMRLSKAEKAKVSLIAKKKKRTLTSIVYEAIEKLK